MNATVQALRNVSADENVVELPSNFAAELLRKPAGQNEVERLEDLHRIEVSRCSQRIADARRKEAGDLAEVAEERAALDKRETDIKAKALSEVAHLDRRLSAAQAYLDAIAG